MSGGTGQLEVVNCQTYLLARPMVGYHHTPVLNCGHEHSFFCTSNLKLVSVACYRFHSRLCKTGDVV